ncbi:MAG: MFS transporter, partial [Parvularculaceae bacterium]|nr:MFS transporter [Parvularculaceae bacterium]
FNVARSLGPALGGAMLAAAGAATVFVVNAFSFLGLINALVWRKIHNPAPALPPEPMGEAIRAGLRYVAMSPTLPPIYLRSALFAFGGSIVPALAPLVAHDFLNSGPIEYGLLLAGFGAGSLFGALMLAYFRVRYGVERLVTVANIAYTVAVFVLGLSRYLPLSICMMAIAGACWIFVLASVSTSVQLCSPRWIVGRAIAFSQIASVGGIAIGAFVWGAVAKELGLQGAFLTAAGYLVAASFIGRIAPLPQREFNLSPNDDLTIPPPRLHIDNQTGPIIVTIEYEVPQKDAASFLATMHQLGRIRKRDGAQRWRIFQDIDRPEIWFEQIESATWLDHLRRASRFTIDDMAIRVEAEKYRTQESPALKRMAQRPRGSEPLS